MTIGVPAVRRSWYEGYLSAVIVRDIGDFASLRDAKVIPKVLSLVAARAGSPMVHADVARDLAVRPDTVRGYLDIVFLTATVPCVRPDIPPWAAWWRPLCCRNS